MDVGEYRLVNLCGLEDDGSDSLVNSSCLDSLDVDKGGVVDHIVGVLPTADDDTFLRCLEGYIFEGNIGQSQVVLRYTLNGVGVFNVNEVTVQQAKLASVELYDGLLVTSYVLDVEVVNVHWGVGDLEQHEWSTLHQCHVSDD